MLVLLCNPPPRRGEVRDEEERCLAAEGIIRTRVRDYPAFIDLSFCETHDWVVKNAKFLQSCRYSVAGRRVKVRDEEVRGGWYQRGVSANALANTLVRLLTNHST